MQVNRQTGNRLRQQLVDSVTGEPEQSHDKGRGYEVGENQFLLIQDEELEAAHEGGADEAVQRRAGKQHRSAVQGSQKMARSRHQNAERRRRTKS